MEKIMVFIPMYNCEKQIIRVINQFDKSIIKYINEIVIVNNRSTDNGEEKVKEYLKNNKNSLKCTLLRNDENYNLGGSHKVAFDYAIKNKYDYVIIIHGDDQGNIKDILPYLENKEYKKYDSLLGSRFMKKSKLNGYSKFRTIGNICYNVLFSCCMFKNIKDLGAGLNMYKVETLKNKYYEKYPDRLTFNCYMLLATKAYKQNIKFFPITWREDDQVSNVKMVSQAWTTFKIAINFLFEGKKYLEKEQRDKIIDKYSAKVIFSKE